MAALALAASSTAASNVYDSYACTLQGQTGITYIVEGTNLAGLRSACLGFKDLLQQRQLRWGLHSPSYSSGERAQATWIAPSAKLKLTVLTVDAPAKNELIRGLSLVLKPAVWHRVSTRYYP